MRPPGGELTFYTALGMLYGVGATIAGAVLGLPGYFAFAAIVGLPPLGVWLQWREAGLVLAIICLLSIPFAAMAFLFMDETLVERLVRLVRIGVGAHFGYLAYLWWQDD